MLEKFENNKRGLNNLANASYVLSLTNSIHIKVANNLGISIDNCIERHAKRIRELISIGYLDDGSITEFLKYQQ